MEEKFNVSNPSVTNIELAFMHVYYYLHVCGRLKELKDYHKDIDNMLDKLIPIMDKFIENKDITKLSMDQLQDLEYDIQDLNYGTQELVLYYPEWTLVWMDSIITMKEVKEIQDAK